MRNRFLSTALLGAASLLARAPAAAEEADPAITVTASRIRAAEAASLEPTIVLPAGRMDDRNLTNLADALNETPAFRGSVTPAGAQSPFGQGVNFVNFHGLGTSRTLVLVDGRRVVSSNVPSVFGNAAPGSPVDLNALPAILVDRVERVSVGGAPVHGADAIAGTVNVVLKRRLEGLDLRASTGVTSRGDNFRRSLAGAGGFAFAEGRGHFTAALGYDRVAGVLANRRSYYRSNAGSLPNPCSTLRPGSCSATNLAANLGPAGRTPANDGRVNPDIGFNDSTTDGFPGSVLVRDVRLPNLSNGGVVSSGNGAYRWQFAPDGSLVPFDRGTVYGAPIPGPLAIAAGASGGDGFAPNDSVQITSGLERLNAALLIDWAASDRATVFVEGLFYRGKADELVQQPSYNATVFSGVSGALTFRLDNPLLSDQARRQLRALGYSGTFQISRANADLADLTGWSESRLYRLVAGLRGGFGLAGRDYDYEVSVNYGRNLFTDHGQNIDQQRFVNAVNLCGTTAVVTGFQAGLAPIADPACAPLSLFGAGAPSAAARKYVLRDLTSRTRLEQFVAGANLGGAPFDLFGNPAGFNLGFEHHSEKGRFRPDPFLQAGLGRSTVITPTTGSYRLDEVFGEVLLPVVTPANRLPIARLDLFARGRHVRNSITGRVTAWAFGTRLAPIADLELRGNLTRSFRAPAIGELFALRTAAPANVPDLCSASTIGAGPVPEIRRANCAAFLARYPGASPLAAAIATVPSLTGGNPDLRNEVADSRTFGAVLRPRILPGLEIAADYIDIRIARPIASLTVGQIAQGCFDDAQFDVADPARGNAFCALIRRDANGQVPSDPRDPAVVTGYVNSKRLRMSGVQASLSYAARLGGAGSLALGGELFHLRRRINDVTGVAPARSDGLVGDPRWRGQARLRYAADAGWGLAAFVNYTGKQLLARTNRGPAPNDAREFDHFRAFATVDATAFVEAPGGLRIGLSVTNLFDRVGQRYYGLIVPASINDALGRRFALAVAAQL